MSVSLQTLCSLRAPKPDSGTSVGGIGRILGSQNADWVQIVMKVFFLPRALYAAPLQSSEFPQKGKTSSTCSSHVSMVLLIAANEAIPQLSNIAPIPQLYTPSTLQHCTHPAAASQHHSTTPLPNTQTYPPHKIIPLRTLISRVFAVAASVTSHRKRPLIPHPPRDPVPKRRIYTLKMGNQDPDPLEVVPSGLTGRELGHSDAYAEHSLRVLHLGGVG